MCGPHRTRTCTRRRRPPTRRRAHIAGTRSLAASAATPDSPDSPHRCRTTTGTPQPTSDSARPLVVAPHSRAVEYSGQMNTPRPGNRVPSVHNAHDGMQDELVNTSEASALDSDLMQGTMSWPNYSNRSRLSLIHISEPTRQAEI